MPGHLWGSHPTAKKALPVSVNVMAVKRHNLKILNCGRSFYILIKIHSSNEENECRDGSTTLVDISDETLYDRS